MRVSLNSISRRFLFAHHCSPHTTILSPFFSSIFTRTAKAHRPNLGFLRSLSKCCYSAERILPHPTSTHLRQTIFLPAIIHQTLARPSSTSLSNKLTATTTTPPRHFFRTHSRVITTIINNSNNSNTTMGDWKSVGLKPSELRLDVTLFCGQVFRWRRKWDNSSSSNDAKRQQQFFVGVLGDAVIELQQTNDDILYRVLLSADPSASSSCCVSSNNNNNNNADSNHDSIHNRLLDFFNVGTIQSTLENMYSDFAKRDPLFARVHTHFPGVRVLRQDPFECMITFLCTSNNNIARITMMIDRLCQTFGTYLGELELPTSSAAGSTTTTKHKFYSFPTAAQLSKATEAQLRELGFGYRAGYLVNTITKLAEKAAEQQRRKASPTSETSSSSSSSSSSALLDKKHLDEYFASIRSPDFSADKALDELSQYPGIGLKCAACIALYSLDKHNCVPIDVHMWRLARTTYLRHKIVTHTVSSGKSLTPRRVKEIMQIYEDVFGPFAGWAQMVLFATQLASFKKTLPKEIVREFEEKLSSSEKGDEEEENEQVENNSHENTTPTKRRTTTKTKTKLTAAVAAAATATTTKRKNSSSSSSQVVVKQQQQQQEEESGAESAETSTLTTPIKTRSRIRYGKRIRPSSSSI